jgi:AmmeMemoRadiSam system protein B
MLHKPFLRPLDVQPVTYLDQPMWLLRDPLQLSDQQLIVPATLAQVLIFCDGTRTPEEIHQAFCERVGVQFPYQVVADALAQLDDVYLLENERSRQMRQKLLDEYRGHPFRPPALADLSYPSKTTDLITLFQSYGRGDQSNNHQPWTGRGIVSPHIDYHRGGPVYARTWHRAAPAVLEAELVIIFGTDHNGRAGSVTLTRQPYATPFGVLPTDRALIDCLAEAVGPEAAYAEEINHRDEHSVELSAVWLHYVYHQAGVAPRPMIPILVGSFHHFLGNGAHPSQEAHFARLIERLQRETNGRRVLVVGSVDLAHVGPNFGDNFIMDRVRRAQLKQEDSHLIHAILQGNAAHFYDQIAAVEDRNRICGFAPLYLMLSYLGPTRGVTVAYDHCAADPQDTSLVSICGLLLE